MGPALANEAHLCFPNQITSPRQETGPSLYMYILSLWNERFGRSVIKLSLPFKSRSLLLVIGFLLYIRSHNVRLSDLFTIELGRIFSFPWYRLGAYETLTLAERAQHPLQNLLLLAMSLATMVKATTLMPPLVILRRLMDSVCGRTCC